ncbi:suz domain-containing protein 1-like [Plakobranchus ocellatus]|uniref:SUZ RNA-binding domain-containing n=1 Tax=Plakobranchus ocellatus TaxID=259542 RepID=A0AAV4AT22_9GAST|nr:suz domain-containing protein 1-like [Plakobranchus ocellatus]
MAEEEADVLDNWEEQADSGMLDKRLDQMEIDVSNKRERKKQVVSVAGKMMMSEEGGPTPYQPQVRILKRNTESQVTQQNSHVTGPSAGSSQGSSKHSKSLQQREAEYAQARLRILGSLPPADDEEEKGEALCNNGIPSRKACDGSVQLESPPQIVKLDPSQPRVAILRQPKSPDGTSGFKRADHT